MNRVMKAAELVVAEDVGCCRAIGGFSGALEADFFHKIFSPDVDQFGIDGRLAFYFGFLHKKNRQIRSIAILFFCEMICAGDV